MLFQNKTKHHDHTHPQANQLLYRFCYSSVMLLLLLWGTGCAIEGGVDAPTPPGSEQAVVATATPPRPDGFRIGLLAEPRDLLPYHDDLADQRMTSPLSELLFPSPLLPLHYVYTNTIALERMPSFHNGDIELRTVAVYVDDYGDIISRVPDTITTTTTLTNTTALTTTDTITDTAVLPDTTHAITTASQVVITYRWNPNLRWSDGVPVTADDSVFAYELARMLLLGDEALKRHDFLERYERVDDHTTRAYLHPEFLDDTDVGVDFTDPTYMQTYWTPLPRHMLKDDTATRIFDFAWTPVGYGPYMIERREEGGIRMKRNPYYAGTAPAEERLIVLFYSSFEVLRTSFLSGGLDVAVSDDVVPDDFQFFERDTDLDLYRVSYVPGPIWEHIDFNLDITVLQDIRVRQAIAFATNRQAMVDRLYHGHVPVMYTWVVTDHWAMAPADLLTRYDYNPEEANRLLDEVTQLDTDGNGTHDPMTLNIITTEDSELHDSVTQQFQADMAAIGIVIEIQKIPSRQFYDSTGPLYRREFHVAQFGSLAGVDPGGLSLWSCRAVPNEENSWTGNNFAGWCFYNADQAIRMAATAQNRQERQQAYLTQQQLFTQELPAIPLFQRLSVVMYRPDLHHVQPDSLSPITWNIDQWQRQ